MSGRLHGWLAEHFSPLVLVIASPEAEALCARSGLSVVDLLAPHCHVRPNGAPPPLSVGRPARAARERARAGARCVSVRSRCGVARVGRSALKG